MTTGTNLGGQDLTETFSGGGTYADPNAPYSNTAGANAAATLTLVASDSSANVTEGADAFSGSGNAIGVTFEGPGDFELLGTNSYSGSTVIFNQTTVTVDADNAFGSGSVLISSATLDDAGFDLNENITIDGTLSFLSSAQTVSTTPTLSGTVVNDDEIRVGAGMTVTFTNAVTGNGVLYLSGGGSATFDSTFGQQVDFENGAPAGEISTLTVSSATGSIVDFSVDDQIVLSNVTYAAGDHLVYVSQDSGGGFQAFDLVDASNDVLELFDILSSGVAPDARLSADEFVLGQTLSGNVQIGLSHAPVGLSDTQDFNADGTSDPLWQNSQSGALYEWDMGNNGAIVADLSLGSLSGWSMLGAGDFVGNGGSDVVWQSASGSVYVWFMNDGAPATQASFGNLAGWSLIGTGDFNGDGVTDMLWQNQQGDVYEWSMAGGSISSNISLGNLSGWTLLATGDFYGYGVTDMLWRNQQGDVYEWPMVNGLPLDGVSLGTYTPSTWKVIGAGDTFGEGTTDLIWQNQQSGAIYEWKMQTGENVNNVSLGTLDPTVWSLIGVGDYRGVGTSDLLWRNDQSGAVYEWEMQGGAHVGTISFGAVPAAQWHALTSVSATRS